MLNLGLTSVTFRKLNADEILKYCTECNLSAIEWGGDVHVPPDNINAARLIGEKTRSAGICTPSYGSYFRLGKNDDFDKYLKTAKALGADIIRIWGGDKASSRLSGSEYKSLIEETKAVCKAALSENIQIAFEYHNDSVTDTAESALSVIRDVNCENLGMYFQYDPWVSFEKNTETLKAFLPYLKMVHVFYVDSDINRFSVKDGEKIWKKFIKILKGNNADVFLLFEFLRNESLEELKNETAIMNKILCEV